MLRGDGDLILHAVAVGSMQWGQAASRASKASVARVGRLSAITQEVVGLSWRSGRCGDRNGVERLNYGEHSLTSREPTR